MPEESVHSRGQCRPLAPTGYFWFGKNAFNFVPIWSKRCDIAFEAMRFWCVAQFGATHFSF